MNKLSVIFGWVILFTVVSCGTEKKAIDDSAGTISSKDYPYIEHFHKAIRLKVTGRYDEAVTELEKCLEIKQDDDAVYYALSKLELLRDNTDKSAAYIEKAAALDPGNTWYIQELAYMYYEREQYPKAVENFKKLVDKEPRNVDWMYGYAESLVNAGEEAKAIEALTKTEAQVGHHPELSLKKYQLYMKMKKVEEGEKELLKAKEEFPKDPRIIATLTDHYFQTNQQEKATQMLNELVEADPNNGRAHLTLAEIYRQQGDREKSYSELKKAFESVDLDIDTKMKILIQIHESSYKIDPEVYELLDVMESLYPTEAKTYSIKGDYLLRAEDEAGALEAYRKALKYDKSQYPVWNQVLIMEYQQSKFEDLYSDSKECLELFPTVSTVYLLNGVSANQLKKYDAAIESLSVGIELVLSDDEVKAEFYGQLGEAYFGIKEYEKGIDNYQKGIKLSPGSLLLKNNFAFQLANHKRNLDLAESLMKQVLKEASEQPQYIDTYGWVLFQKKEYEEAKKQFEKAYASGSSDKMITEHLGDVNFQLNNKSEAIELWKKALELDPENELLRKKINDQKYYDPID